MMSLDQGTMLCFTRLVPPYQYNVGQGCLLSNTTFQLTYKLLEAQWWTTVCLLSSRTRAKATKRKSPNRKWKQVDGQTAAVSL